MTGQELSPLDRGESRPIFRPDQLTATADQIRAIPRTYRLPLNRGGSVLIQTFAQTDWFRFEENPFRPRPEVAVQPSLTKSGKLA